MSSDTLNITLECSAGAELLFAGVKQQKLALDGTKTRTIGDLLEWLSVNKLTGDRELFMQEKTVRPGILVLINDTDWELLGELEYELQPEDNVLLISTLHGG